MSKPTPAQAIMLREITEHNRISASYVHGKRPSRIWAYTIRPYKKKRLNASTFRVLLDRDWIRRVDQAGISGDYEITESGRGALASLSPEGLVRETPKWSARDIVQRLRDRYSPPEWVFIPELRIGTSYGRLVEKRIDGWAINCWRSQKFLKISFEIKVYRSDWLRELKDPKKRLPAMSVSNEFYFVVPKGIIKKEELPEDCGLIELLDSGSLQLAVRATTRMISDPPWSFVASIGRRSQAEMETQESAA